jgi:hypothetical protein
VRHELGVYRFPQQPRLTTPRSHAHFGTFLNSLRSHVAHLSSTTAHRRHHRDGRHQPPRSRAD